MTKRTALSASVALLVLAIGAPARAQPSSGTAWLSVTTPVGEGAVLLVDGEPVSADAERIPVTPGQHTVTAELRDGRYFDAIVDVTAGARRHVTLGPPPPAPEPEPEPELEAEPEREARPRAHRADLDLVPPAPGRGSRLPDRYPSRALDPVRRIVGLGVTTLFATCMVVFALETQSLSDAYQRDPTQERYDEGVRYKNFTQYGLFPATLASAGLTALAFILSTPSAE